MKALAKRLFKKDGWLYRALSWLYRISYQQMYYILRIYPIRVDKIVFSNFYGDGYGDSPKYIAEEMIRQGLTYDLVWLLRPELLPDSNVSPQIRTVRYGSLRATYEMVTAGVWVGNVRQAQFIQKRHGQKYIQTFHGGPSLKRVEKDVEEMLGKEYVRNARADSKKVDLFLSNGTWYTSLIRSSFWYGGEVLESGFPRNDVLLQHDDIIIRKVRQMMAVSQDSKIVLYAPTFRDNEHDFEAYNLDISRCLHSLSVRFSGDWKLIVRLHPNIRHKSHLFDANPDCMNVTYYDDVQELLSASDVVITDYSGLMFDFALRRQPVFLYAPDVASYTEERNFYFQFHELPFRVAWDNDMLIEQIKTFDAAVYVDQVNAFFENVGSCDRGVASSLVVERIKSFVEK